MHIYKGIKLEEMKIKHQICYHKFQTGNQNFILIVLSGIQMQTFHNLSRVFLPSPFVSASVDSAIEG